MSPTPTEECEGAPELLRCPCCGSPSSLNGAGGSGYFVACETCNTSTGQWATAPVAVAAWNRRLDPVRASVIEECAKVADALAVDLVQVQNQTAMGGDTWKSAVNQEVAGVTIARRIRALAKAPIGSGPLADADGSMPSNSSSDPVRAELLAALKHVDLALEIGVEEQPTLSRIADPLLEFIRAAIAKGEA